MTRRRTTWVEVCAGSCAMAAHLSGWTRRPTAWLGSKWGYRAQLEGLAREAGLVERPRLVLYDAGPVVEIAPQLMRSARARELAAALAREVLGPVDAAWPDAAASELCKGLEGEALKARARALTEQPVPLDPDERAAHGAVIVAASFGSAGLQVRDGRWVVRGGLGRQGGSLRAVRHLPTMPSVDSYSARVASATPYDLPRGVHPEDCVVFLDPPYASTAGYQDDMPRLDVIALCQSWRMAGAAVILTEATPVEALGWRSVELRRTAQWSAMSIAEVAMVSP
jgi:hypothetical protein